MSACSNPIQWHTLVDLWTGSLPPEQASAVEEHVFACDDCARASDRLAKLVHTLRDMVPPVISHRVCDRLREKGRRIRFTPVEADVAARARFTSDVDLLIHVLRADVTKAERIDMEVVTPDGTPQLSFEHVPFDASTGEVLVACQRHYQGMFPSDDTIFRLHAFEGGERRRLGDYFVHHEWE
jgi:hypothetical protein